MYYYFASTLPMIHFDGSLPFSVEDFERDCERLLRPRDYAQVRVVLGRAPDGETVVHPVMARWLAFDRSLQQETVRLRSQQLGRSLPAELSGGDAPDPSVVQIAVQALKTENFLDAQKMILRFQWDMLDDLAHNRDFSLSAIFTYGIKLQILERLQIYKTDRGSAHLEEIMGKAVKSEQ